MENDIKPLDCIFFKGTEIVSKSIVLVEKFTMGVGQWSHVGIVVNKDVMPSLNVKDNDLYIWESTISSRSKLITGDPTVDAESDNPVFGVQLRKLKDVVGNSLKLGVGLGLGRLINNPTVQKKDETQDQYTERLNSVRKSLDQLHKDNYHRPYTKNILRLFASVLCCSKCCRSNCCYGENQRFCSQFVSIVYKALNIIPDYFDSEVIVPQDLATPENSHERLPKILEEVQVIRLENWFTEKK